MAALIVSSSWLLDRRMIASTQRDGSFADGTLKQKYGIIAAAWKT
jgi:hypothetical protein